MTQLSELFSLSHSTSPVIYKTGTYSYAREYYMSVNQAATIPTTNYYIWESQKNA